MEQLQSTNQKGQSLVEILIAMGLMAVLLPALLTGFVASREAKPQKEKRLLATALLREAEEAVRSIREEDWDNVATNGTYHPEIVGTTWDLISGSETIDAFTRSVQIGDFSRTGGTDPSTKLVTSTVSWQNPIPSSVSSITYLTRYLENTTWNQTTQAEFSAGTNTNVSIVNNNGGEVELTASSGGSWASPIEVESYNASGSHDGLSVFSQGNYLYLGTDTFYILNLSDPLNLTLEGSTSIGDNINDIHVSGNYAYLATDANSAEFQVVDISTISSPSVVETLNLDRNNNAYGIFVSGNYAYLGRDASSQEREFYVIDISTPTSVSVSAEVEIGADVNEVYVSGSYAYLATDGTELQLFDVSSPSSPSSSGTYNSPGSSNGESVFVEGSYAYLVTANNGSGDEFYIVDVSTPSTLSLSGSFNIGAATNDVYVSGDYAFIASENNSAEFQVIDITTKTAPSLHGSYSLSQGTNAITVNGNYAYLGMDDQTKEFVVVEGGSGGGGSYQTSGNYESQTFDAGAEVAFNYITGTITEPSGTDVQFQVATNSDNSTWNFYGPDGTTGTYFDNDGGIHFDSIIGQYLKFKAYLIGDGNDTPILEDVTINYSP